MNYILSGPLNLIIPYNKYIYLIDIVMPYEDILFDDCKEVKMLEPLKRSSNLVLSTFLDSNSCLKYFDFISLAKSIDFKDDTTIDFGVSILEEFNKVELYKAYFDSEIEKAIIEDYKNEDKYKKFQYFLHVRAHNYFVIQNNRLSPSDDLNSISPTEDDNLKEGEANMEDSLDELVDIEYRLPGTKNLVYDTVSIGIAKKLEESDYFADFKICHIIAKDVLLFYPNLKYFDFIEYIANFEDIHYNENNEKIVDLFFEELSMNDNYLKFVCITIAKELFKQETSKIKDTINEFIGYLKKEIGISIMINVEQRKVTAIRFNKDKTLDPSFGSFTLYDATALS